MARSRRNPAERRAEGLALLVVAALLTAACGDGGGAESTAPATTSTAAPATTAGTIAATTTSIPLPPWPEVPVWADPAVAFLDAYRAALGSGDLDRIFPFLDEGVIWWDGEPAGRLRIGLRDTLTGLETAVPPTRLPGSFFAGWYALGEGLGYDIDWVHEAVFPPEQCPGADPCRRLQDVHLWVGPGGISGHSVRSHVADLRDAGRVEAADLDRVEATYAEIAARLSSGDPDEAALMMSDQPVWENTGDGTLERIDPRQQWADEVRPLFAALPDLEVATLTTADLGFPGDPEPAVFFTPRGAITRFGEGTIGGVGVYRLTPVPGQSLLAVYEWLEQPHGIVDLDFEMEPAGMVGFAAPMIDDPTLWPRVPDAVRHPTGTIPAGDGEIQLFNGSDSQQDLVEWALGRYAAAGLPSPIPRSIAFPPSVDCILHAGLAVDTGEGVDLQLCFDQTETCAGDSCTPSVTAQSTLLHELGHVWTIQHVAAATRAAFLEVRGLQVWSDPGIDRDDLGTEHAAEILAWALLEEDNWPARLPGNDCGELAAGFRVLTGHDPPRGCPDG